MKLKKLTAVVLSAAVVIAGGAVHLSNAFAANVEKATIHLMYTNNVTKETKEIKTVEAYKGEVLEFLFDVKAKNPEISAFSGFSFHTYFNQTSADGDDMYSSNGSLEYTNEYYSSGVVGRKMQFGLTICNPPGFTAVPAASEDGYPASFFLYSASNAYNDGDFTESTNVCKFTLKVLKGGESYFTTTAKEVYHYYNEGSGDEYCENNPDLLDMNFSLEVVKPVPRSIKLSEERVSMKPGETKKLKASVSPENADSSVTWFSTNPTVADVDNSGVVTAMDFGNAEIVAMASNGVQSSCIVYVIDEGETMPLTNPPTAPAVTVSPSEPSSNQPEETEPTESGEPTAPTQAIEPTDAVPTENVTESTVPQPLFITGDVDGDGVVNAKDRIILTRNLAKWTGYGSINEAAADVNHDGAVNAKDRIILTRYLSKWSGYETLD